MVILENGILTAEISETGAQLSRLADRDKAGNVMQRLFTAEYDLSITIGN